MKSLVLISMLLLGQRPPASYTVSGTLQTPNASLYNLIRRDGNSAASAAVRSLHVNPANNQFEIQGIGPGVYDLYVLSSDAQNRQVAGSVHFQIRDRNLDDISVALVPFVDLKGRFVVSRETFTDRSPRISLKPSITPAPYWMQSAAVADEDGAFDLFDVPQGSYTVTVTGLSRSYSVTEIRFAGRTFRVSDAITIDRTPETPLDIVIGASR